VNEKENYMILFLICIVLLLVFSFADWGTYFQEVERTPEEILKDFTYGKEPKYYAINYTGWNGSSELFNIRIHNWQAVVSSLLLSFFAIIYLKKRLKVLEIFCLIFGLFSIYHLSVWLYFLINHEKHSIGIGVIITLIITIVALVFNIKATQLSKNTP
jgi:hypothetical protein